jgi:HJR/Mrr/RecB family endonuclease
MFESQYQIMNNMTWQAFERNLCRLLTYEGYDNVRLVGQTGDHGADVTGNKAGKKWLFQAKHWKKPVGLDVAQETINAVYEYKADIPVIVSSNGFDAAVKSYQSTLLARKIPLQLWDSNTLVSRTKRLPDKTYNTRGTFNGRRSYRKAKTLQYVKDSQQEYEARRSSQKVSV